MTVQPLKQPDDGQLDNDIPDLSTDFLMDGTVVDPEAKLAHISAWIELDIYKWLKHLPGKMDLNINEILHRAMKENFRPGRR